MVGITALEGVDTLLPPTLFVATTVNVYAAPFVNPVKVTVSVEPPTVTVWPPGLAVTV